MKKTLIFSSILFSSNLLAMGLNSINTNTNTNILTLSTNSSNGIIDRKLKGNKFNLILNSSKSEHVLGYYKNTLNFVLQFKKNNNENLDLTEVDLKDNKIINTKSKNKQFNLLLKTSNYNGPVILSIIDNTNKNLLNFGTKTPNNNIINLSNKSVLIKNSINNEKISNLFVNDISQNSNFEILFYKNFKKNKFDVNDLSKYQNILNELGISSLNIDNAGEKTWFDIVSNYIKMGQNTKHLNNFNIDYLFGLKSSNIKAGNVIVENVIKQFSDIEKNYLILNSDKLDNTTYSYFSYLINNYDKINKNDKATYLEAIKQCYPIKSFDLFSNVINHIVNGKIKPDNLNLNINNLGDEYLNKNVVSCQKAIFNISSLVQRKISSDNFAVRPDKFEASFGLITSNDNSNVNKNYFHNLIHNKIPYVRAGDNINVNVITLDGNNKIINNFNDNFVPTNNLNKINGVNFNYTITGKLNNIPKSDTNNYLVINKENDDNIYSGKSNIKNLYFKEVGKVTLKIKENRPYAKIDENEKGETKDELYITPATLSFTSIPFKYQINVDTKQYYKKLDGSYKYTDYTILSNDLLETGTKKNIIITGLNKNNNVTKYLDSKYFVPKYLKVSVQLNTTNVPISITKGVYNFLDKYKNNNFYTNLAILNSDNLVNKIKFIGGKTVVPLYLNYNRKFNQPVKEFTSKISNLFVTDGFVINNFNSDKENTFRYLRFKVDNLITPYTEEVPYNAYYQYYSKSGYWTNTNLDNNLIKSYRVPLNNYYKGIVDIEYKNNAWVNNGKQIILFNVNTNIKPLSFFVHYDIPKWLWFNPLDSDNVYNFNSNNCLYHPCNKITITNNLKNSNDNSSTSSDNNNNNEVNPVDYNSDTGTKKFNY